MLFPYTYVPHQMEKMQRFVNFIFYQVWCRATRAGPYHLGLFDAHPPLRQIMTTLAYAQTTAGDRFCSQIEIIYQCFSQLSRQNIKQFKRWYHANNDIESVCVGNATVPIARYADLKAINQDLSEHLASFFKSLYSQDLLGLAAMRAEISDIDEHYGSFVTTNRTGKCPFCGINDMLGEYHSKREAYDHYLPKALYPFNSINFKNLVPACHHCNSSYKNSKDPAWSPKDPAGGAHRRSIFYPYSVAPYAIQLQVTLQHSDIQKLTAVDITLQFGPAALSAEIETWKDVYGIEERYKAKLCGESDGKYWLTQVFDECQAYDKQPADILKTRNQLAQNRPYADCNFLRKPFLDACQQIGIF